MAVYESALDLIGDTPIVDISTLSPNPRVRILAKLEGQNPGGSVKDRAAKQMILDAEKDGILTPGSGHVILESSSGNTGIALAMIAKMRGYHLKVVLPGNVSVERRQLLESWGAEIIDSPGVGGLQRGDAARAWRSPRSTPTGGSRSSTGTRPTRRRTTRAPGRRSGATCPSSRTSSRASARRAR